MGAINPDPVELERKLTARMFAACDCGERAHWPEEHSPDCLYRILRESHEICRRYRMALHGTGDTADTSGRT